MIAAVRNSFQGKENNAEAKKLPPLTSFSAPLPTAKSEEDHQHNEAEKKFEEILQNGGMPSARSNDSGDNSTSSYKSSKKSVIDSDSDDDGDLNPSALKQVNRFLRRQGKAFVRNFIDYGPPYADNPYDVALVNECAKPRMNFWEVHKLLNKRLNPNLPDPEDLYYTPFHWCARNAHLIGLKMLVRAGAQVDLTTEMGNTALDLAVMMQHPPDRRNKQIKCIKYLLDHHAAVNTRDKGGYGPIDHAAANNDLDVITLLLEAGASLRRENTFLVAKRHPVLKYVYDPECYKILYERLLEEEQTHRREVMKRERQESFVHQDKRFEKLTNELNKKKVRREARMKALLASQRQETILKERHDKIENERHATLQAKSAQDANLAGQYKDDGTGHWVRQVRRPVSITAEEIYDANVTTIMEIQRRNDIQKYDQTWKQVSHGGRVEVSPWARTRVFDQLDVVLEDAVARQRQARLLAAAATDQSGASHGNGLLLWSASAADGDDDDESSRSRNVDYRDDNDAALAGEDSIDELLAELQRLHK